jgi:FkbM family methyltransferase
MGTKSYSQLNQDTKVIEFYKNKSDGYFLDVGAYNGVHISNTYLLEKEFGWKGICIEPLQSAFSELEKNRNVICLDKAVYSETGKEFAFRESGVLSGITQHIDRHKSTKSNNEVNVMTDTLTNILSENEAPTFIEYMSLDTEGTELEILKGIDFDKYTIGYIDVEHNYVEPRRTEMRKLLLNNGYKYIGDNRWDDIYIHKSLLE